MLEVHCCHRFNLSILPDTLIPNVHEVLWCCHTFKGTRVYTRSAIRMPGSETALEELMCLVLSNLLQEGVVIKLADDLYCGSNTPMELLVNWERVLQALDRCNIKLSSHKTIVCPQSTTILV